MDTFEFLVNLQVFSRRELEGESYLDSGHLHQRIDIGKQMRAEKRETMEDFEALLAPFLVDLRPEGEPSPEKVHEDEAETMATWGGMPSKTGFNHQKWWYNGTIMGSTLW